MYKFALSMTPDHVEAVASQLYMEMLEAGFSASASFIYLHHDKDGRPYANIARAGRTDWRGECDGGHRTDPAAGLLRPFRLRWCRADRGPAPVHQFARQLRGVDGRLPETDIAAERAEPGLRRTACGRRRRKSSPRWCRWRARGSSSHPHRRTGEGGRGLYFYGPAPGRSNGCSTMPMSTTAGA